MRVQILGVVLWSASLMCAAQSRHYLVEETTIKAESRSQFETAQKDYCAAVVRGGAPSCLVLSPTTFSKPDHYMTLLSFGSFAHYDQGTYTSKGLTPEEARNLSARRGPTIAANEESGIQLKLAEPSGHDDTSPIVLVTEIHVFPGKENAFVQLIRQQALPAAKGGKGSDVEIYETEANGDPDRLFLLQHLKSFADLDDADPLWASIPAAQRTVFDTAFNKCVRASVVSVMRYRQDLSAVAQ